MTQQSSTSSLDLLGIMTPGVRLRRGGWSYQGNHHLHYPFPLTSHPIHRDELSKFFEPSIQTTVETIRQNFTEILPMSSVRTFGTSLACTPEDPYLVRVSRGRICFKSMAICSTQPTAFPSWVEIFQARHKHVRGDGSLC